ncbi:flavin-containing monooxygenase 5-like [Diadema antillarum]|uniref:flavin-containing monooxygenase 5-like n=1 Tax=Diadema antillarum TaxID=105358 RepID=UPI003A8C7C68
MKRVAIIGAGVSGLASIKTCLEEGLEPVCFEQTSNIGGVWNIQVEEGADPHGPPYIYRGLVSNICKPMMAFSDFPFPPEWPPYLQGEDVCKYYVDYTNHFDLWKNIRFNTRVIRVEKADDFEETGRWIVRSQCREEDVKTEVFDAVMVCSGFFSSGFIPKHPGLAEFKGQVLHACQFRRGSDFKDKTVLVVGAGHSAGDIAVLCADHAKKVVISLREGAWIVPRVLGKEPVDARVNQRWKSFIPSWLVHHVTDRVVESIQDWDGLGLRRQTPPHKSPAMINDRLPMDIMSGRVGVRSGIQSFQGSKVIFDDGKEMDDVDCVIFATGYSLKFPFVDDEILSGDLGQLDLYLHVLPPRLTHHTMAAVGYVVVRGAAGPAFELQARYAAKVFKGEAKLPSLPEMMSDIQARRDRIFKQLGHYRPMILPPEYQDRLAREIGALPSLWKLLFTDPKLAYSFFFDSMYPPCYRLVGPHAMPGAREAFLRSSEDLMHGITPSSVRNKSKPCSKDSSMSVTKLLGFSVAILSILAFCVGMVR